jgi:hypothetical protein
MTDQYRVRTFSSIGDRKMNRLNARRCFFLPLFALFLSAKFNSVRADILTAGDFLMIVPQPGPYSVYEFTPSGTLVQTLSIPQGPSDGTGRGIAVDANGNIDVFNGTFSPYLTAFNPVTKTVVSNTTLSGWSTVNATYSGGTAAYGNYIFVTDQATAGGGSPNGLIRFNINTLSAQRFANTNPGYTYDYVQVTVGKTGLVYGVVPNPTNSTTAISVFDPNTLAFLGTINPPEIMTSVAVAANGDIYGVDKFDSHIYEFDPNGNLLKTVNTSFGGFDMVSLSNTGQLLFEADGNAILTDETLSNLTTLDLGVFSEIGSTFTTWVEPPVAVPEPSSFVLMSLAGFVFLYVCWRRGRQNRRLTALVPHLRAWFQVKQL